MNRKLSAREYVLLASMLFGMFFGAGNLIFPVHMGQQAGASVWPASIGFCITGVGIPLLGIAAMAISRSDGLFGMCAHVGRGYACVFSTLLTLMIGPLYAIPRSATVPFSVGIAPLLEPQAHEMAQFLFCALFFAAVLAFSLKPSGILTWIGKMLNPLFLVLLSILAVTTLLHPLGDAAASEPLGRYAQSALIEGMLSGYNTMDALAALVFGLVLIQSIRTLGIHAPEAIATSTLRAGLLSTLLMTAIYLLLALLGAQSRPVLGLGENGGETLFAIGAHYYGTAGGILFGAIVTIACLKTCIGLVTSCASLFSQLFPCLPGSRMYAVSFCLFGFVLANFGLNRLIALSVPLLMLLYPLAITLILLCLFGRLFGYDRRVFVSVTGFTLVPAVFDALNALPPSIRSLPSLDGLLRLAQQLPLFHIGLSWLLPACIGLLAGLVLRAVRPCVHPQGAENNESIE